MERVYTNYTASGRQVVLNNVPSSFASITVENIRLIFNETQKNEKGEALDPLAGTGCKENILSVTYNGTAKTVTIVLANTVPAIATTDKLTIKIDMGDGLENMGSAIIEIDTSLLALESTTAKEATVAKEAQATLNKEAIIAAMPTVPTVQQIQSGIAKSSELPTDYAKQGTNPLATNTAILQAFGNIDFSTLAKEVQVKDGNDTSVSVGKEIRSEVGTSSDTAAESGTLFAVVKWVKDKVKSIYNAVTDSTNGLSAIKTSAASAATDAAAAKVAAQSLTSLESDINAGKTALATAITAKGVTTSPTQSMSVMAQNISSITQETIEIDGGEMYAKQLYGVKDNSIVPGYWNLYEVMAYLLTKTSSEQYSILLCEFPKGDEQYVFGTAVSAGSIPVGYVFSDDWQLNGEGSLNIHANTEASHTWNDDLDMKGNRWVAWLFAQVMEGATAPTVSLGAAATNCPQPRSIHIGRHMGTITATANGVLSEIVVTDGNTLDGFDSGSYTQSMFRGIAYRNVGGSGILVYDNNKCEFVYAELNDGFSGTVFASQTITDYQISTITVKGNNFSNGSILWCKNTGSGVTWKNLTDIYIDSISSGTLYVHSATNVTAKFTALKRVIITNAEGGTIYFQNYSPSYAPVNLTYVYIGYRSNDYDKSITLYSQKGQWKNVTDCELKNGWHKPLDVSSLVALTKQNVQDHIFDRLGVNDSGTTVTIHLATAVYDLFTAEEIAEVTTRTSITIARG